MSEVLQVTALPGYPDEIGRWLWALQVLRHRTLELVEGLDQATLDWAGPDWQDNAIGSLLYHIALVEMSWLHSTSSSTNSCRRSRATSPWTWGAPRLA